MMPGATPRPAPSLPSRCRKFLPRIIQRGPVLSNGLIDFGEGSTIGIHEILQLLPIIRTLHRHEIVLVVSRLLCLSVCIVPGRLDRRLHRLLLLQLPQIRLRHVSPIRRTSPLAHLLLLPHRLRMAVSRHGISKRPPLIQITVTLRLRRILLPPLMAVCQIVVDVLHEVIIHRLMRPTPTPRLLDKIILQIFIRILLNRCPRARFTLVELIFFFD